MDGQFKTVATFLYRTSADIACEHLRSAGIPAAVIGDSSPYPSLSFSAQIEVKVNAEDYERALSVLAAAESAE